MRPIHRKELASQQIGDELVILDLFKDRLLHQLNESAKVVWQNCNGQRSAADIAQVLEQEFEVSPEEAFVDVQDLLQELTTKNLIEWI